MTSVDPYANVRDINGGTDRDSHRLRATRDTNPLPPAAPDGRPPPRGPERQRCLDQLVSLDPADLQALLSTLPVIEQAKGLVMGYYGVDADTAFEMLRQWSQNRNVKLRLLSSALTAAAADPDRDSDPDPEPYGGLRRYLRSAGLD